MDYASIKEALELISHICRQTNDSKKYNEIMEVMWDLKVREEFYVLMLICLGCY